MFDPESGRLVLGLVPAEGGVMTDGIYTAYHSRLVELLLRHFRNRIASAQVTAEVTYPDLMQWTGESQHAPGAEPSDRGAMSGLRPRAHRMDKCPQCGAADPESGSLSVKGSADWDIKLRRDGAGSFSLEDPIRAVFCRACGHVELALDEVRCQPKRPSPPDLPARNEGDERIAPSSR